MTSSAKPARAPKRTGRGSASPHTSASARGAAPTRASHAGARPSGRKPSAGRAGNPSDTRRAPKQDRTTASAPVLTGPSGFTALGVPDLFAAVLQQQGITHPYPIQQATIADALSGRDVLGRGRTGSGKTLAFCLPMVTRLSKGHRAVPRRSPRGLVLVPTRELAAQVMETLRPLCAAAGLEVTLIIGGASYDKQISRLSRGTDIIVATPGRLHDLAERAAADLAHVGIVVIDEADQMADLGFLPQVQVLLDEVPGRGQRLLFSATLDHDVDALVQRYLRNPREHSTDPVGAAVSQMEHRVLVTPHHTKAAAAAQIIRGSRRTIVFLRTRASVEEHAEHFAELGLATGMLHGGLSQRARLRALEGFKRGSTRVLLATDVAARGIHVDDIDVVLQFDLPNDHKDYLHRAGRTARAGAKGSVVTLVTPQQQQTIARILRQAGVEPAVEHAYGQTSARAGRQRAERRRDSRNHQQPPEHAA